MVDWREFGEDVPSDLLDGEVPSALDRRQLQDDLRYQAKLDFHQTVRELGFADFEMFERHKQSDAGFDDIILLAMHLGVSYFVAEQKFFDDMAETKVKLEEARQAKISDNINRMIFSR